jgi:xanthine dehydrogenase YagT iron-sulfur-binding subunit
MPNFQSLSGRVEGLKSGGTLRILRLHTLTHNTRVKQTATPRARRRHDGIRPGFRFAKAPRHAGHRRSRGSHAAAAPAKDQKRVGRRSFPIIAVSEHCMSFPITLTVNGVKRTIPLDDPRVTLLDLLRERLHLTGTKKGCDRGQCGACTVIVQGRRINSCLALAISLDGADVLTIEGVAHGDRLHPVQEALLAHDGLQCGFCTPGQIMSAIGLIQEAEAGDDPERVREGMSGNLCRCGAYQGITEAVLDAQKALDPASRREVA